MSNEPETPRGSSPATTSWLIRHRRRWSICLIVASAFGIAAGFHWNSRRPENAYRRGRAALFAGDRDEALRESQLLIDTPGFEGKGHLLAGLAYLRAKRVDQALPELTKAADDSATSVEALTATAECYYVSGLFPEAVHSARTALAKDPKALDARRWLAVAFYDVGATVDAAGELEILSAEAPNDPRPDRLLGLIAKDTERFEVAIRHYRESLRRGPNQPDGQELLMELAESLVKLSRFDEALQTLGECDQSAAALTLAAECDQNLGHPDQALERLQNAIRLDAEHVPAHLRKGTLLLALGRAQEATISLLEAVRLAPQSSQPHFHLAQAYARLGERERADRQLKLTEEAQAVEREFAQLHESAAENLNDADVRYRIGVLADKLRKPELARLWFRAALSVEPSHAMAREALAKLKPPTGNW